MSHTLPPIPDDMRTVPLVPFYGDQARLLDRILNGDADH